MPDIWQARSPQASRKDEKDWVKDIRRLSQYPQWETFEKYISARGRKTARELYRKPLSGRETDVAKAVGYLQAMDELLELARKLEED